MPQNALIQLRRDTAADWTSADPVLELGEPGIETDTQKLKVGDGATAWTSLPYLSAAASIADGSITLAKLADVATATVFYRKTAGTGVPEVQTLATLKTDLGLTGTNSGDQTSIVGITGTLAEFNTALTGADFATGGGTATGTNTGDQTSIVGITGTLAEFNTALTGADFATGGGTATGTNTGDQTSIVGISGTLAQFNTAITDADITPTGPITTSGLTMATARLLGRTTASTGAVEELTASAAKTFLAIASGDVSGLGYFATGTDASNLTGTINVARFPALSGGDVTSSAGSGNLTIGNNTVTLAKMDDVATATVFYRKTAGSGDPEVQTLATLKSDLGLTGTNSGDQTSIVGITGSVAEFNTALTGADFYTSGGTDVALADGGTGASLTDPGADRLMFWDDSAGTVDWLTLGTNLSITGTTINATGGGGGPADGDYGDVAISGTGTVYTVESAAGNFTVTGDATINGGDLTVTKSGGGNAILLLNNGTNSLDIRHDSSGYDIYTSPSLGHYFYIGGTQALRVLGSVVAVDSGLPLQLSGGFNAAYVASPTTPSADYIHMAPQRLNASGGRVFPRWKSEDAVLMSMPTHPGRNTVAWGQAIGGATTAIASIGMANLTAIGTATNRVLTTASRLTRAKRLGYVSAGTAGSAAGLHNSGGTNTQWTVGGEAGAGFLAIFRFAVSDASLVAGAHAIIGMRNATGAPAVATNPNTLTSIIALCQTNGSTNWMMCYGGSAAQTPIDTGIAISNTGEMELILYARPDVENKVTWRLENISTLSVASGELTGTIGTALPAKSVFLGPLMWRSNNATASAVGIDIISYYIESDFA